VAYSKSMSVSRPSSVDRPDYRMFPDKSGFRKETAGLYLPEAISYAMVKKSRHNYIFPFVVTLILDAGSRHPHRAHILYT
jgi:hypothetical protein